MLQRDEHVEGVINTWKTRRDGDVVWVSRETPLTARPRSRAARRCTPATVARPPCARSTEGLFEGSVCLRRPTARRRRQL